MSVRAGSAPAAAPRRLADFSADKRTLLLAAMALAVGTFGALAAWVLVSLIALTTNLVWFGHVSTVLPSLAHAPRTAWTVFAPAIGGLVVGLMARYGSEGIRGHGIPEAIETILIGNSRIAPRLAVLKPLSSAIAIGTGGPFGAEGPIIMTGGALGSLFAQFFQLSAAERKTLLVAGAAAGMTAIFGTPVAAVLLAVELLLFEWKPRSLIPVAVAAVVAIAWRPLFFGAAPLFPTVPVPALPSWDFGFCLAVGLAIGLASNALTLGLSRCEDLFEQLHDHLHPHWMWWPMLGGLVVGLGGLIDPRALGVGYDAIGDLLRDRMTVAAVVAILLVKAVIWLVSLSSGTSGGVLAPLLIIGGALGALLGFVLPGAPAFWALLGMAAMLGGALRAPLTAAVFAVELTGDLHALPALLAATITAYAVTVLTLRRSILTEKISRRGRHITQEYSIDPFELTRAAEIMVRDVATLPATQTLAAAAAFFAGPDAVHAAYPVVDGGRFVGTTSRADALRWRADKERGSLAEADGAATLGALLSDAAAPVAYPDQVVGDVVDLMIAADIGLVPVVDPETRELRGIISRKDLLHVRRAAGVLERERTRFYARRRGAVGA